MPEEVFNLYFRPLIDDKGWPFSSISDSAINTIWDQYFDHMTLCQINDFRWHRDRLLINENILYPASNSLINMIILDNVFDYDTPIRRQVSDSKIKFWGLIEYIKRTGVFPAPVVLVRTDGLFRILDGNHRIAALFALGLNNDFPCDAWIGLQGP